MRAQPVRRSAAVCSGRIGAVRPSAGPTFAHAYRHDRVRVRRAFRSPHLAERPAGIIHLKGVGRDRRNRVYQRVEVRARLLGRAVPEPGDWVQRVGLCPGFRHRLRRVRVVPRIPSGHVPRQPPPRQVFDCSDRRAIGSRRGQHIRSVCGRDSASGSPDAWAWGVASDAARARRSRGCRRVAGQVG